MSQEHPSLNLPKKDLSTIERIMAKINEIQQRNKERRQELSKFVTNLDEIEQKSKLMEKVEVVLKENSELDALEKRALELLIARLEKM